jgi:phosphatidylserine decarboxylase
MKVLIASVLLLSPYGAREIVGISVVLLGLAGAACLGSNPLLAVPPLVALVVLLGFFRDPPRRVPRQDGILLAPADGKVVDIGEVEEREFVRERAVRVGIFLSVFDVHLNRSPVEGVVEFVRPRAGRHGAAFTAESTAGNESNLLGIRMSDGTAVAVRQITGAVARRIVCRVAPGDRLEAGQKFGMIKFGSRTEVYVPASRLDRLLVAVGSRVRAGESILGVLR